MNKRDTDKIKKIGPNVERLWGKPVFGVSDQVRHKPGFTATGGGYRLGMSDLANRGIVLSV